MILHKNFMIHKKSELFFIKIFELYESSINHVYSLNFYHKFINFYDPFSFPIYS